MTYVYRRWEAWPFDKVCGTFVAETHDGREARHYYLKTWFLENRYDVRRDDYSMQRAVLFWHGHEGFRLLWLPVEQF